MIISPDVLKIKLRKVRENPHDYLAWKDLCYNGQSCLKQIATKIVVGRNCRERLPAWLDVSTAIDDVTSHLALHCHKCKLDGNVFSYLACIANSALSHIIRDQGRIFGKAKLMEDIDLNRIANASYTPDLSKALDGKVSFCRQPGCSQLVASNVGYCEYHASQRKKQLKRTTYKVYTREWRVIRDQCIAEQPSCQRCGRPGTVVHHILAVADGGTNQKNNLEVLCRECHEKHHKRNHLG